MPEKYFGHQPARGLTKLSRTTAMLMFSLWLPLSSATAANGQAACQAPPPPISDLDTRDPYQDKSGSIADDEAQDQNSAIRAPLNRFLDLLTRQADRYHRSGSAVDRACAISTMVAWTSHDALEGHVSMQGEAVRQWAAGTVALAAYKLGAPQQPLPASVRNWLLERADDTRAYMKERIERLTPYGRTNIYYWAILTVGSIAIVTDQPKLWTFANREYLSVLPMIGDDGTLAAEMRRKSRASLYHAFAAQPLVTFAALAKAQRVAVPQASVDRLMKLVTQTIQDPQFLAARAGASQRRVSAQPWFPLYAYVQTDKVPTSAGPHDNVQRLGGSVKELVLEIDRRQRAGGKGKL